MEGAYQMTISQELFSELLIHGNDDWVDASEVVSIIIEIEKVSYKEEEVIRNKALELIRKAVTEGYMVIGSVPKGGFRKWELSSEESLERVEKEWTALGKNPGLGQICWLSNTVKGNEVAIKLLEERNRE